MRLRTRRKGLSAKAVPATSLAPLMVAVALAIVASVMWLQLRAPSQLLNRLAEASANSGVELNEDDVAALISYVQRCSLLGLHDLPLKHICKAIDGLPDDVFSNPSQEIEASLAREAHRAVLAENGGEWISKFHRLRINRIVNMLSRVAGDNAGEYKVVMLDTPQINAFSTADGRIYLTKGLVITSSDDEIALAIAHEMHHIRSGHWMNWWALSEGNDGLLRAEEEDWAMEEAAGALVEMGVDALAGEASTSYEQEYEADASAILHAAECGYVGRRIFRILTRLPEMPVTSHPTASDRIAGASCALEAMADSAWIAAHSPSSVARNALESAIAAERGDRSGIYLHVMGLDEVALVCVELLKQLEDVEEEMRAHKWLGSGWPYEEDSRIVVRTLLFSPVLYVADVGIETTFSRSSAGTPGALGGRLWLVRRGGVWVVVLGQVLQEMRPVSPEWAAVSDELANAWRRVDRIQWPSLGSTEPQVLDGNGDADVARGALEAAARWRDTSISDFEEHLSTYATGRVEYMLNADGVKQASGSRADDERKRGKGYPVGDGRSARARRIWSGSHADGSLEAIGWAQFLSGREVQSRAWNVRCDVHSRTLATVAFSSALSLEKVPLTSNFTRLTMVLEDEEWKVASVSLN